MKDMIRYDCVLEFAWKNEGVQTLEVSLLHAIVGEHFKQTSKKMVYGTNPNAKLCGDS